VSLPVVALHGAAREQGRQHGEALRGRIRHNLEVYFDVFAREGLPPGVVRERAAAYLTAIERQSPAYAANLAGIAGAADVGLAEIAALSVRYELLYYQFGLNLATGRSRGADGCTAFALQPSRTADGHLWLGQNWDWLPDVQGAVLHTVEADGLETLAFTEAGIAGGKIGLNSAGLGLAVNGLTTTADDWRRFTRPFHLRCYEVLRSATLATAIRAVTADDRPCAANFLLAQVPDTVVDLEAAPTAVAEHPPSRGYLVHANHFWDPQGLGVEETPSEPRDASEQRQACLTARLQGAGLVRFAQLQDALRDHTGFPESVCRHADLSLPREEHFATVAAVILDLTARQLAVTDGPPCGAPFLSTTLEAGQPVGDLRPLPPGLLA
jgi:isopenicillin-N N-acyltransferase-like protein